MSKRYNLVHFITKIGNIHAFVFRLGNPINGSVSPSSQSVDLNLPRGKHSKTNNLENLKNLDMKLLPFCGFLVLFFISQSYGCIPTSKFGLPPVFIGSVSPVGEHKTLCKTEANDGTF